MNPSTSELIGIEIEFQLIDEKTLDLADRITPLLESVGEDPCMSPEVFQSCIEIRTIPSRNTAEAELQIKEKLNKVMHHLPPLGLRLCALGVHPFSKRISQTTLKERYLDLEKEFPYINHHLFTFSTHVHISVESLSESIRVMNQLRLLLPVLISLSASCPFYQEEVTGFVSFRQYQLKTNIHGGSPPHFEGEEDFLSFLHASERSGAIHSLKDIHWDIKPRPDLGTLELRILDASPTIREAMALCALARCLMIALKYQTLEELLPSLFSETPPGWAEQVNYFQAVHLGQKARYIVNSAGETFSLKEITKVILKSMEPWARKYEELEGLHEMKKMLEAGLPYERMNRVFEKNHSFREVVNEAANDLSLEMGFRGEPCVNF